MKVFISQPMRGKTDVEILKVREEITEYAKGKYGSGVEILESFFSEVTDPNFCEKYTDLPHPLVLLGESLKLLAEADVAIFAAGWGSARGCCIEHSCCDAYGIPTDDCPATRNLEPSFVSDYR